MNLQRSAFRSNLRGTTTNRQISTIDFQSQLIDTHMDKSYMFQMANKSKKKQKKEDSKGIQNKPSQIRKSHTQQKKFRIFQSVIENIPKKDNFNLLLSNLANQEGFSCCNPNGARQLVNIWLSPYKEMKITNKNQQIIYQFNFNTIQAKINQYIIQSSAFVLEITDKIILKFQIQENDTTRDIQQLKKTLTLMIDEGLGKQFNMQDLKNIQDFQKRKYCPNIDFAENCQTGDILLFRGNLFWAKVQRFITFSDYDHVGVIYKDPVHGILIFQATSSSGICLTPWDWIIKYKWYQYIDRIVWRKLSDIQRTDQFIQTIQNSIIQKLGKAYHISFQKIMINQSYMVPKTPPSTMQTNKSQNNTPEQLKKKISVEQQKQKQGYFCSQLAAKIYKELGLLPINKSEPNYKPSNNFYPYHFTQRFNLVLKKGRLSDQSIIHFNAQAIKDYYSFDDE